MGRKREDLANLDMMIANLKVLYCHPFISEQGQ